MDRSVLFLVLILLAIGRDGCEGAGGSDWYTCTPGVEPSPGVSLPRGDISLELGGPAQTLTCHLNPAHDYYSKRGLRAQHLSFGLNGSTLSAKVLNDTTIREEVQSQLVE